MNSVWRFVYGDFGLRIMFFQYHPGRLKSPPKRMALFVLPVILFGDVFDSLDSYIINQPLPGSKLRYTRFYCFYNNFDYYHFNSFLFEHLLVCTGKFTVYRDDKTPPTVVDLSRLHTV